MPLNYSKWDQLELSDDSDIEGHPNVDKKSLIRWKQRDIHEKREKRKHKIQSLTAQIACNKVLLPRIKVISKALANPPESVSPPVYFNAVVEQLQTNPSKECPPGNDPSKLEHTYDGMILSLLKTVGTKAKDAVKEADVSEPDKEARLAKELAKEIEFHVNNLAETIEKDTKELEKEEAEQKKHITMDDLHDGYESKYVPPVPAPPPVVYTKPETKNKGKEKETTIEVLNPKAAEASTSSSSAAKPDDDEDEGMPELTSSLEAFSKIPLGDYQGSFEFIQQHRDVYVPGASDALLVAAFTAERDGNSKYAKQCVHQSLLIQYCEKLGRDGVGVFFKKMVGGDKRALKVFVEDVESTYRHVVDRVKVNQEEEANEGREQIQLVPENPSQSIAFQVPEGPPPENLVLEGPGTEGLDIEEVRKALQFRWDVFQGFSPEMQAALREGALDGVNKVLGEMSVSEAEALVGSLDVAGILNFAESGIRDETGKEEATEGA